MKKELLTVKSNRPLNESVFELVLSGASPMKAGQFAEITAQGFYLRRPISLADYADGKITLLVKKVGEGTKCLSLSLIHI